MKYSESKRHYNLKKQKPSIESKLVGVKHGDYSRESNKRGKGKIIMAKPKDEIGNINNKIINFL